MKISVECGKITIRPSDTVARLTRSLTRVHRELGQEYQLLVQKGFENEKSPAGAGWQALSPATVKKRGSAHPILRVSGRLAGTHTRPGTYLRADAEEAVMGSNLVYAATHQHGGEIKRKGGTLKLHFKKFKRGPRKGRALFSKEKQATYGMKAAVGPYSIRIPARPWLFNPDGSIPAAWRERLAAIVKKYLEGDAHA